MGHNVPMGIVPIPAYGNCYGKYSHTSKIQDVSQFLFRSANHRAGSTSQWEAMSHTQLRVLQPPATRYFMMTSSNGNIFRVTGHLRGEVTGPGEFPTQRPVTQSSDVFFDLRLNKRLSKQPWGWWFETPSWSLWRHCNVYLNPYMWRLEIKSHYIDLYVKLKWRVS